jgi:transcriptional regulator with XRE-family HTH domain
MSDEQRYDATLLAKVLRDQGRKQRWLAAEIGTNESLVSEWVNGRRTVSEHRARQVASVLGVPFYLLFHVTEESKSVTREAVAS